MRSRGLVVAIAIVLAVVAAAAVILYTNQVRENALGDESGTVVVATQDIPAGTQLDQLIEQGVFVTIRVPADARVEGAVTTLQQLAGQTTTAPVLAREQIPASRLSSGTATQSAVGVSDGNVGVAVTLGSPQAGAGQVQIGDSVVVYATFDQNAIVLREDLEKILTPKQLANFLAAAAGGNPGNIARLPAFKVGAPFTVSLVPTTRVLRISNPLADPETGRTEGGEITVMLDLSPEDAEAVVFAMEQASVWLGLLPPSNKDGYGTPAVVGPTYEKLIGNAA
jgi:pilus assembly protein CpaB